MSTPANRDRVSDQLLRYAVVGGIAFVIDFGSLWLLTELAGIHYLLSAAIAFILGLTTNYLLSITWVFGRRSLENKWLEFGIFALIGIVGLGLNELIIWFFTEWVHFHYLVSKIVSTIVVFLWNFFVRRYLLFR
jgi:putative flippase GtrA